MKLKSLIPNYLNELEFTNQASFDAYKKKHPNMRSTTKVKISGKETTVGDASKKDSGFLQKISSKLFGKGEKNIEMPKLDPKHPLTRATIYDPNNKKRVSIKNILNDPKKYKHLAADVQATIDVDPKGAKFLNKLKKKKDWQKADKEKPKDTPTTYKSASTKKDKKKKDDWYDDATNKFDFGTNKGFGGFGGGNFGGGGAGGNW